MLHAVLAPPAPVAPPLDPGASSPASNENAAPAASQAPLRDPIESGAAGTVTIPAPERWYGPNEVDSGAVPLTAVQPEYPAELSGSLAVPATVRLRLYIDERGVVRKMEVARSGPRAEFDEAALRAWERVRFTPAMREGLAVKSRKLIELDFQPY